MRLNADGTPMTPGEAAAPGAAPGGSDLMGNIRAVVDSVKEVINTYKGTLELEREVQRGRANNPAEKDVIEMTSMKPGEKQLPPPPPPPPPKEEAAPPPPDPLGIVKSILDNLIAQGNGDKTIGEVIKVISPFTIKQAREFVDGIRPPK